MKAAITSTDASKEFTTEERCFIIETANDADDPEVSIARARTDVPAE